MLSSWPSNTRVAFKGAVGHPSGPLGVACPFSCCLQAQNGIDVPSVARSVAQAHEKLRARGWTATPGTSPVVCFRRVSSGGRVRGRRNVNNPCRAVPGLGLLAVVGDPCGLPAPGLLARTAVYVQVRGWRAFGAEVRNYGRAAGR